MMATKIHHPARDVTKRHAPAACVWRRISFLCSSFSPPLHSLILPNRQRYRRRHLAVGTSPPSKTRRAWETYDNQLISDNRIHFESLCQQPVRGRQEGKGQNESEEDDHETDVRPQGAHQVDQAQDAHPQRPESYTHQYTVCTDGTPVGGELAPDHGKESRGLRGYTKQRGVRGAYQNSR
jgi:hypothetical protein